MAKEYTKKRKLQKHEINKDKETSEILLQAMLKANIDITNSVAVDNFISSYVSSPEFREKYLDTRIKNYNLDNMEISNSKKYDRNDKVNVEYKTGEIRENIKYKLIEKDLNRGLCDIID